MNHEKELQTILEKKHEIAVLEFLFLIRRVCCDYLNEQTDEIASVMKFFFNSRLHEKCIHLCPQLRKLKKGLAVTPPRTPKKIKTARETIRVIDKIIVSQ